VADHHLHVARPVLPTCDPAVLRYRPRAVRVLTFNIHHGVGLDGVLDLDRTARVIEGADADVVALQEVDRHFGPRSGHVDQAGWLGHRLALEVAYGPVVDRGPVDAAAPGGPRRQYGIALLSRSPIARPRNVLLPSPHGGEQRGLLGAHVEADGVVVRMLCTHLQVRSRAERLAQARAVAASVAASDGPAVVMGDLNARPGASEIAPLTDSLVDAWITAGQGDGHTFDAAEPYARIDYVLTSPGVVATQATVLVTDASDHRPVMADLAVG
jgi:endonuclease/exonuclease/phosphatase family metal-dependent hydrolase